jgi:hypothetical protein
MLDAASVPVDGDTHPRQDDVDETQSLPQLADADAEATEVPDAGAAAATQIQWSDAASLTEGDRS